MPELPEIDRLAGIECYCTSFSGTGGLIKQERKGFRVSELVAETLAGDLSSAFDEQHRYPLYLLEKEGVDSNHALLELEHKFGLRLRVMGIKDAKAVTTQFAGSERVTKDPPRELHSAHSHLYLKGFTRRPLSKDFLAGNHFEISVRDVRSSDLEEFVPQISKIGNFYGLQRFGSERLVTHLVGREIVKRNFGRAVELLLSYTTKFDTPESREMRQASTNPSNYRHLANSLPRGMDIERLVMSALAIGKEPVHALRAIPLTIRRLYVQAYQAFIFNRCLSTALSGGADIVLAKPGDLCFEMEGPSTFGRIAKFENLSPEQKAVPAIRMAGYSFQSGKGRFEIITKKILEAEGIVSKDFYIKEMQELSQQGGFRQAPLWCTGFEYRKVAGLTVSFDLPKGSYATTLMREIMKPTDPIRAGF